MTSTLVIITLCMFNLFMITFLLTILIICGIQDFKTERRVRRKLMEVAYIEFWSETNADRKNKLYHRNNHINVIN